MELDTLIDNGRIWTGDSTRPWVSRVGVFAGRVVGVDEELDGLGALERLDLGGAPAVPGFHDAHLHFSLYGHRLLQLDLSIAACPDLDSLYAAVRAATRSAQPGEWILGAGYDQNKLGTHPARSVLDGIAPDNPVFLEHTSGHMGVANAAAFAVGGFGDLRELPRVAGGRIERDHDGLPTGLLQERAQELVNQLFLPVPLATHRRGSILASRELLALGITSVTEPGVGVPGQIGRTPVELRAYQDGIDAGEIGVRLNVMPYVRMLHELGDIGSGDTGWGLDLGIRSGFGDDRLRVSGVKVLSDGSLLGRTAAVCCAFDDSPGNTGVLIQDATELTDLIIAAHRNGWQVATHAIGDRALDLVMDAVHTAQDRHPRRDPRHRIEHCGISRPDQLDRVAALGLIPNPQGSFIAETGDGLLAAVGVDRAEMLYRMSSWLERGIVLPGSTDAPIVGANPLVSIHAMVNRRTEQGRTVAAAEGITTVQALRAYTFGSAYAAHEEKRKGTIARGMLADLAVLSDDPLAIDPAMLDTVSVGATIVGGALVYDTGAVSTR